METKRTIVPAEQSQMAGGRMDHWRQRTANWRQRNSTGVQVPCMPPIFISASITCCPLCITQGPLTTKTKKKCKSSGVSMLLCCFLWTTSSPHNWFSAWCQLHAFALTWEPVRNANSRAWNQTLRQGLQCCNKTSHDWGECSSLRTPAGFIELLSNHLDTVIGPLLMEFSVHYQCLTKLRYE